jgi:hypothetical protein
MGVGSIKVRFYGGHHTGPYLSARFPT